ncbi:urea amidolyase associated protein UAAP1 [Aliagarivorans marinus]|uniref:urea amidolyase associated protein UAAP1 n=1 Tax=Aliagarivorans marinus TaxID=561965 RepID=UPI00042959F4|nr:urea amidolyase associated protein UAAP1 [Aliagarivorans marinus]
MTLATLFKQDSLFKHEYQGGQHGSLEVPAGYSLRFTDVTGGANCSLLMYNPRNLLERINLPDTLKCQHTFKMTTGNCVYSDMGRIFCSIVADDTGWIDSVGGFSNKALVEKRWGKRDYQNHRNAWCQNGQDSLLTELAKFGLGLRDLAGSLNLFSKVVCESTGQLVFTPEHSKAGSVIELRFEMDTVVAFSTCAHPMDSSEDYPRNAVLVEMVKSAPVAEDDACLNHCDENRRGFENTLQYQPKLSGQAL